MRSTENVDADTSENPLNGHAAQGEVSEEEPESILKQLLSMLYNHEDRQAAVAAALKAVLSLQEEAPSETEDGSAIATTTSSSNAGQQLRRAASEGGNFDMPKFGSIEPSSSSPNTAERDAGAASRTATGACCLDQFPACNRLIGAYRKIFKIPNKTPLSVLYEYASRLNLTLLFEEKQDGSGLFTMTSSLRDSHGTLLYELGAGTARAKKDAKQLAAAALLEVLLEKVPFQDLLYKSEKQQLLKDAQGSRNRWQAIGRGRAVAVGHPGGTWAGQPAVQLGQLRAQLHDIVPPPQMLQSLEHPTTASLGLPGRPFRGVPSSAAAFGGATRLGAHGAFLPDLGGTMGPAQHSLLLGSLLDQSSHRGQAGFPTDVLSRGALTADSRSYQGSSALRGGNPWTAFPSGMHRNLDTGDGFCGGDMGGSIEAISDCDASTFAMREADLAAMSLDQLQLQMSQQQQQHHQQQHLMDAVSMRLQQQQQQM